MAKEHWKKIGSQIIFEHPRLTVAEDDVMLPNGKQIKYMRYEGLRDYVTIIAKRDNEILLVSDYSYPHDEWLWQFPEGDTEPGESLESSAQRELEEESGYHADKLTALGFNYDHHRRTARKDYIFIAEDLSEVKGAVGDEEEVGIHGKWFTVEQVNDMIQNGVILQKNTLAAWTLFLLNKDK